MFATADALFLPISAPVPMKMASDLLHADDTPIRVFDRSLRDRGLGKGVKKGRIWAYVRDQRPWSGAAPPGVTYHFAPDWKEEHDHALRPSRKLYHLDGRDQKVSVEVSSVIRALPDSFRVAWTEKRYENGQLSSTEHWTAILTVVLQTSRTAEALRANPLGIYVNAVNWSREMSQ